MVSCFKGGFRTGTFVAHHILSGLLFLVLVLSIWIGPYPTHPQGSEWIAERAPTNALPPTRDRHLVPSVWVHFPCPDNRSTRQLNDNYIMPKILWYMWSWFWRPHDPRMQMKGIIPKKRRSKSCSPRHNQRKRCYLCRSDSHDMWSDECPKAKKVLDYEALKKKEGGDAYPIFDSYACGILLRKRQSMSYDVLRATLQSAAQSGIL